MPRSPLTEQYERILTIVDEVNSWPDDERNFLLDRLDPKEEEKLPTKKKSSKKSAGKGKSARASSLQQQIQSKASLKSDEHCTFQLQINGDKNEICGATENDPIHDETFGYGGYHPFVRPAMGGG